MTWVRIDDHFDEHPKFAKAGPLGIALWLAGLAYCNRNRTDGFIPWAKAQSLLTWSFLGDEVNDDGAHKVYDIAVTSGMSGDDVDCDFVAALLVRAGLWEQVDGGYRVHDYADYQPTKEQIEAEQAKKVTAGRAGGKASAQARAQADAEPRAQADAQAKSNPKPVPGPVPGITPLSPPTGGRSRAQKPERKPITDEDKEGIVAKYAEAFGTGLAVREEIDAALNNVARFKAVDERLYVDRWLRREIKYREERQAVRPLVLANGHASEPTQLRPEDDHTGERRWT